MKKSYSSLNTLSTIITVLGYINLFAGLIISFVMFNSINSDTSIQYHSGLAVISAIGIILLTLLSSLFFWALGQFIKLCINVANDISVINENTFYIANNIPKKEKNKIATKI